MKTLYLAVILLVVGVSACSTQPTQRGSSRSTLTAEEIAGATAVDLYMVVLNLRPQWLRQTSAGSPNQREQIWVYLDGMRMGGIDQLRQIAPNSVASVQFLSGLDASQRYGLDHGQGAIVVSSRR